MVITKQELIECYDIIKKIIDYRLEKDQIKFIFSEIAPNTFEGMKAYYDDFGQFLVYSGGDHGYLGQEYNIKFRALHDFMHCKYDLSFKFEDEKVLSEITAALFCSSAYHEFKATHYQMSLVKHIINAEIKGQIEYYEKNKKYVEDQTKFIDEYLEVI